MPPSVAFNATPEVALADGNAVISVSASFNTLNPQQVPSDIQLMLLSSEPSALITQFGALDANGLRWAQIRSLVPGTETLTLMVVQNVTSITLPQAALVTFNPLPPPPRGVASAHTSSLVANPNFVADDGDTATTLTFQARDAYGIPVPGVGVTFTSAGSNNFFSNVAGITDVDGVVAVTLASTTPETKTVTAHTDVMAVSTSVTFSPLASSSLFSTLSVNPNTLTADGVTTAALTLTVRNAEGSPMAGAPVAWTVTGGNNTLVVGAVTTDANGIATATLTSTRAETKTVTGASGAAHVSQSVTFQPGPIDTTNCTFAVNPNRVLADNASVTVLTFTARDAFGNGVANVNVSFSSSGSNNTLNPSTGTTDGTGTFCATLASRTAESKTVTANSGSLTLNQTVLFVAGAPSTATAVLSASPNVLTADGISTSSLALVVEDAQGNPVPGQAVTFSASGTSNIFSQSVGTTDGSGSFTTTLASTTAETKLVSAQFGGVDASTDVTFTSGPAASNSTTVQASPTSLAADGLSTTALTVLVRDAYGNPVGGQWVTLASTGSNNTLTPVSGSTDASGAWTATMASPTAEVKTVTATAGAATATAAVTFTAGSPNSTTTTFVASPTSLTADGSSQSTLTVSVYDAHGNRVANQGVTLSSTGSNNTIAAPSGSTNASGVYVTTIASPTAEVKTLTATVGTVVETAVVTFVAGTPAAATTTVVASPNSLTADGSSTTTLTVTVRDGHGNVVANQGVSLSSSGSSNTFGSSNGTTNSAGVYTTTLASSKAEVKTVTAAVGSANATTTVTFKPGAPTSADCSLSASPTSVTADGTSTTQLTFVVKDAFGNPVANQAVSLSSTGSTNTFTPTSGVTDSTGTFVSTFASTKAELKTVTGTAGTASATANVTFVAGTVSTIATTLVANPNSVAADGSSVTTLVTTALDAHGNPVPGQTVSMSAAGANNSFASPNGSTNGAGTFTTTLASTTVQTELVSALVAGTVTVNTNVTFTTPTVSVTNSTIAASPNSLTADGSATTTLTVTVLNGADAPVMNAAVTMSATGTNNTFAPASGTTTSAGVFTTTLTTTKAGVKTITATVDGTAIQTTVTFLAGAPSGTTTTLVANPNLVTADGASKATLTVVVLDINGNPDPNQTVVLSSSGGNSTFSAPSGTTDATGTFTATLESTKAETKTVTATVNGNFNETTTVAFVAGTVSGATTTLVASPNSATANGSSTVTLTATVKDAAGNPVPNQVVALSSTGSNNTFTPPSGSTNAAGVFTATMASTKAELKNVQASIGSVNENANVLFVAGAASSDGQPHHGTSGNLQQHAQHGHNVQRHNLHHRGHGSVLGDPQEFRRRSCVPLRDFCWFDGERHRDLRGGVAQQRNEHAHGKS